MSVLKKYSKYIFIYIIVLISMSFFLAYMDGDTPWTYGFSYAISIGEIPYKDFNMVLTPLHSMIMAIPMLISHNILVYYLETSLLITITFYLLFKKYHEKTWLLFLLIFFPLPCMLYPSYNFLLLFLLIIIIYLEEKKSNDYLIGIILGLLFLTKQSVGLCLCLVSFYYLFKDYKKFFKRVGGFLIPVGIFIIYLIITDSLYNFIDLCFLGLFDFAGNNGKVFNILFFVSLILLGLVINIIRKDKSNIAAYYVLMFYSILIPLFDLNHLLYFNFAVVLLYLDKLKIKYKNFPIHIILFTLSYIVIFFIFLDGINGTYPNKFNNFEFRNMYNQNNEFKIRKKMIKYYNNHKNAVLLFSDAYFYKITNDDKLTYFDLLNYGNHGYNGTKKMINRIKKMDKDTLFIINEYEYRDNIDKRQQINKDIIKYVKDHGKVIKKINGFYIYKLK